MTEFDPANSPVPSDADGPVFSEPWEAQSFAIVLALHKAGLFRWSEWTATLADEIKRAETVGDPGSGTTYYRHWQAALERMVTAKGMADRAAIDHYSDAWSRAARRTPHGTPIALTPADFEG